MGTTVVVGILLLVILFASAMQLFFLAK
jgi:hypothetical protein